MVDADDLNLISNGTPQWGAVASLFAGSLLFAWYDAVISVLTALFTVPTRVVGGLIGGLGNVLVRLLEAPADSISTAFATSAAELRTLGLGPLALIAAVVIITVTWWVADRLGDAAGGGD
jgi:hypothetical protein